MYSINSSARVSGTFQLGMYTTTQRNTLVLGLSDSGILVYDTSLNTVYLWDGTQWVLMSNISINGDVTILGDVSTAQSEVALNLKFTDIIILPSEFWTQTSTGTFSISNSVLTVTNGTAQTRSPVIYISTKQINCLFTSQLTVTANSNTDNEIGYGYTDNVGNKQGIFLYADYKTSTVEYGVRLYSTGTSTTCTDYPFLNSVSGFDFTKAQIFKISLLWFGYWGFEASIYDSTTGGFVPLINPVGFTNSVITPFLREPSLPFMISSANASSSVICTCIGINVIGGVSNNYQVIATTPVKFLNTNNVVSNSYYPLLALRLKSIGKAIDLKITDISAFISNNANQAINLVAVYIPYKNTSNIRFVTAGTTNPVAVTFSDTFSGSHCEYSSFQTNTINAISTTSIDTTYSDLGTMLSGTDFIVISNDIVTGRSTLNVPENSNLTIRYNRIANGSDMLLLYGYGIGISGACFASVTFREV